jgi:hypothetical protein
MSTPNNRPLWEVMQSAYLAGCKPGSTDCHGYAAELHAIADAVVPEEESPGFNMGQSLAWQRWTERQRIRNLLLAEAERAEVAQ